MLRHLRPVHAEGSSCRVNAVGFGTPVLGRKNLTREMCRLTDVLFSFLLAPPRLGYFSVFMKASIFAATYSGQSTVHDLNWLYDNLPTMKADFNSGSWTTSDDTLAKVLEYINTPGTFFHQSHTLIHLSRDQLRYSDCYTEDTGKRDGARAWNCIEDSVSWSTLTTWCMTMWSRFAFVFCVRFM